MLEHSDKNGISLQMIHFLIIQHELKFLFSQSKLYLSREHQWIVFYPEPEASDKIY
jgi:hypothetical protein